MTMHLVRGMTTLNTRKKKSTKMTAGKLERLQKEHREHNKHMKRLGCHINMMTFDEYVDYVHGNYKPKTKLTATNSSFKNLYSIPTSFNFWFGQISFAKTG